MRRTGPLAALLALGLAAGAAGDDHWGGGGAPRGRAPRTKRVVFLAAAPASLLQDGEARPEALFVRLASLAVGGNFDAAAAEEVLVTLRSGGREARLDAFQEELGSSVKTIERPESHWLELPPAEQPALTLLVEDDDATSKEQITRTPHPVRLHRAQFGTEALATLQATPLATIEGTEAHGFLYLNKRPIHLEGARAVLALVRAPRRAAADGASRELVRRHLRPVLELAPPDPTTLEAAVKTLEQCAREAAAAAGRSTHTHARRVLHALAVEAAGVAERVDVGVAPVAPERLERELRQLVEAARALDAAKQAALGVDAVVLGPKGLAARPAPKAVDAALVAELRAAVEALRPKAADAPARWRDAVTHLADAVLDAGEALDAAAAVREGLAPLQAKVRAES